MPVYTVEGPGGKVYTIEGPEGATPEQLGEVITSQAGYSSEPPADYSNEGRGKVASAAAQNSDTSFLEDVGGFVKDLGTGLGRSVTTAGKQTADAHPATRMLAMALKAKGVDNPVDKADRDTKKAYDEAGFGATLGSIGGDILLAGGPANAVGKAAGNAVRGQAPGVLRKALGAGVELATAGGAGAAVLPPSEGGSRAVNALQGAGTGIVLGGALGGAAKAGQAGYRYATDRGVDKALARAGTSFEKTLGKGRMDAVTNNLDLPRELPMSTAAAAGRDELMALERISRSTANPVDNARWGALDARTKGAAWNKMGDAVGDDLAQLQPRAEEAKSFLQEAQNVLDKVKITSQARKDFSEDILKLKDESAFQLSKKAQTELNNIAGMMGSNSKVTAGGLARFETDLQQNKSLSPPQRAAIWEVVRKHLDAHSGGAWSEAYALRGETMEQLGKSKAANSIVNDFQDAYGGAKGKTSSGDPELGSQKLQASIIRRGTDVTDPTAPKDMLEPKTREELGNIVAALRKAEAPVASKGGSNSGDTPWGKMALDARGNPVPGANYWMIDLARKAAKVLGDNRSEATRRAADLALRSPEGWQKMLKQMYKSREISASDAAMIARILRGSGSTAAAVSSD